MSRPRSTPLPRCGPTVELALERQEGGKLKRRILFYKMLAAASVVFAMAIAGVGYYNTYVESQGQNGKLLTQNTDAPSKPGREQQADTERAVQPTDGTSTDSPEGDRSLNASAG
ncbi:MAG: hypothetical protein HC859_14340, partial [Bacteroidia bacterium]|nr:hypothetical protein [Bacteroidia bacterium]